jgi:hypothetical protein
MQSRHIPCALAVLTLAWGAPAFAFGTLATAARQA